MTFEDFVEHYELYLAKVEPDAVEEARARLLGVAGEVCLVMGADLGHNPGRCFTGQELGRSADSGVVRPAG